MRIGAIQIAMSGFCFGFLGIFGKLAFQNDILLGELLTLRFFAAAICLAAAIAIFRRSLLRITYRELVTCAGLGCLGYAVFSTLYFTAIQGASVALASLLLYTYPVLVSMGAHFLFKEHLTKSQWFAIPITILGLIILITGGGNLSAQSPIAVIAGLASAICYAIYILASSRLQKNIAPLTSALYVILFAALALLIVHRPSLSHILTFGLNQWLLIFAIAVVCTVLPLFLFLSGLQKLGNTQASLISTIEPVTAAFMGVLILSEDVSLQVISGGLLVLIGLAVSVGLRPKRRVSTD